MILVDLNQVMISNLMVQLGGQKGVELEEDLFRHMILNSLRSVRKKFNGDYGELVICCDDKNFWRRQRFPYYKANRKKYSCLLYTSPSPRDLSTSRMPSSA